MSGPKAVNRFLGGVDRDTAPEAMDPQKLRGLTNFRYLKMSGGNYTCRHVAGNKLLFSLTDGFVPLGSADYGGISFIFSVNPVTGEGEVGTWPSPDPSGLGGFVHAYSPLMNWTGPFDAADPLSPRLPLRTLMFNFTCARQMEVEVSTSYDGSTDLYFTDWINPLRGINCGFNVKTGAYNDRRYWTGNLINSMNLFFEDCPHPVFDAVNLLESGRWPAGNTIFYARYSTASLDKTSFLAESNPVQVSVNLPADGVITDGDPAGTDTGKSVELHLVNINPNFPYIEIAFAYYSDDTTETGLIDKTFTIPPGVTDLTVVITGFEDVVDITLDELIQRKETADSVRSITQFQSILWGCNWREPSLRTDLLANLAQTLIAKPPAPGTLDTISSVPFKNSTSSAQMYKDYQNTFREVGYFRGETYSFAIVFVLNGGKETIAFPVQGYDAWMDPGMTTLNSNGALRMPSNMNPGYVNHATGSNNVLHVLGVTFDLTSLVIDPWILANVCGFYVTRAERKKQLVYQGNVANAWLPDQLAWTNRTYSELSVGSGQGLSDNRWGENWLAEFQYFGQMMIATRRKRKCQNNQQIRFDEFNGNSRVGNKFGVFSTDHFFSGEFTNGMYYVVEQGKVTMGSYAMATSGGYGGRRPEGLLEDYGLTPGSPVLDMVGTPGTPPNYGKATLYNVAPNEFSFTGPPGSTVGFTSKYAEGGQTAIGQGEPMWWYGTKVKPINCLWEYGNRSIQQRRYLGLVLDEPGLGTTALDARLVQNVSQVSLVNIYKSDPVLLDIASLYQPQSEFYFRISDFIPISDFVNLPTMKFYRGDCFLARTYHRQTCSLNDNGGVADDNSAALSLYYKYANMIGAVQETEVNTSMRSVDSTSNYTYYPAIGPGDPGAFAFEHTGSPESSLYNRGYNRVLGLYGRVGHNSNTPVAPGEFPNRIRYSAIKVPGEFADAYKVWDLAAFKDFDPRSGPMVKIGVEGSTLFTVAETGLKAHSVRERGIVGDGQGGSLVIGEGELLSERTIDVSDTIGSQHQFSIIKGISGHYGYDQGSRSIWRYRGGQELEVLSVLKQFKSDIYEISELLSQHSDILHRYPDAAVCQGGVVGWMDSRFHEVGWSFFVKSSAEEPTVQRTIVFNEEADLYGGERTHHSPFYLNLATDFFSCDPSILPVLSAGPYKTDFYLHDVETEPHTSFYGQDPYSDLTYVVAVAPNEEKVFDAVHLFASPQAPTSHRSRTEYQESLLVPFISPNEFERPLYKEGAWRIPFLRANVVQPGQDLFPGSMMKGKWMETRYQWSSPEEVAVASATTIFRLSLT